MGQTGDVQIKEGKVAWCAPEFIHEAGREIAAEDGADVILRYLRTPWSVWCTLLEGSNLSYPLQDRI